MRARIRSIKPEILSDEDLWDLGEEHPDLHILQGFEGLWMYADKEGRFKWRPRALGAAILPYWGGDFSRVLDALATRGFVVRYEVDGREYGAVRTFRKHQVINHRESESELPAPPTERLGKPTRYPTRDPRVDHACSTRPWHARGDWEGNGIGKGSGLGREFAEGSADVPLAAPAAPSEPVPSAADPDPPQRHEQAAGAPADALAATVVAAGEQTALAVPSGPGNRLSTKPQRKPAVAKPKPDGDSPSKSAGAWQAYASAYHARYGTPPVRNARVNAQMAQFVGRVAADEAPLVAEHYLSSQNSRYLASGHSVGCLLQDAEKLRTEWATGKHGTAHAARTVDRTSARGEAYREVIERLRLEDEADARRMSNGTH